eukprot:CAMPEP_0182457202 /NCGR_PEP_ID=MMETSP1319-20130603/2833_1 /TAXON_ID=172717 /ORGANISM="Bolidomonas pacifica, Strain RCC208" /LENGTH=46 /DNA_ID= /DNA_START= /DNA_END= /DNA_ORIENTATION=
MQCEVGEGCQFADLGGYAANLVAIEPQRAEAVELPYLRSQVAPPPP